MVEPGMSPDQQISELYAQADKSMATLKAKVASVQQAQQQALQARGEATSQDGSVRAVVDATGVVTSLVFAPSVFDKSTPQRLAQTVVATIQSAAAQARGRMAAAMAPVRADDEGLTAEAAEGLAGLGVPKLAVPEVPRTAADPTARDAWLNGPTGQPSQEDAAREAWFNGPPGQPVQEVAPQAEPMRAPGTSNSSNRTTQDNRDSAEDWLSDERPW